MLKVRPRRGMQRCSIKCLVCFLVAQRAPPSVLRRALQAHLRTKTQRRLWMGLRVSLRWRQKRGNGALPSCAASAC